MTTRKTYHIEIWGCQMNVADAAAAARQLESLGYTEVPDPADADVVLLETCCVREKPEHKVYSRLGELRPFKVLNPRMRLVVCGCMAQKEGKDVIRHAPFVDLVIGPRRLAQLPALLDAREATGKPQFDLAMDEEPAEAGAQDFERYRRLGMRKAFVNIIEGCNYHCAYCIVPFVRGKFTSRTPDSVVEEVRRLVDAGVLEVTLLGQSVLAYGRDRGRAFDIVDLFERLHEIPDLARIRFTTNHPLEVNDRIIDAVATMPKVMEHFHMPIQAGDDGLLKAMKRGYTVARYEDLLAQIRARIPGVSVTSDVIVGFPGETDEIFETCLDTYRRLRFDQQFMFVYSPRPGTPAAQLPDLPQPVKVARMNRLVTLQNEIGAAINEEQLGTVLEILVDGPSERDAARVAGRARNDKAVVCTLPAGYPLPPAGAIIRVRTETAHLWGFGGSLVTDDAE